VQSTSCPSRHASSSARRATHNGDRFQGALFNLRFQSATGQLESHGRLRAVKRDIARIYTVLRERELGIRATPAPVEAAPKATKKSTKKAAAADEAPAADTVETAEEK
jgi:large subunit ribosomal protein L29